MKLVTRKTLIDAGTFTKTPAWKKILSDIEAAIDAVHWPPSGKDFAIYPESGKKRNEGNGVVPIKAGFQKALKDRGWKLEERQRRRARPDIYGGEEEDTEEENIRPGAFDAWLDLPGQKPFVVEWETGNVSSSHRALNKMAMGVDQGILSGGILVVPDRKLAQYLTDRIGNFEELRAYFPLWSRVPAKEGYLGIIAVEHDRISRDVDRIPKMTAGRALG